MKIESMILGRNVKHPIYGEGIIVGQGKGSVLVAYQHGTEEHSEKNNELSPVPDEESQAYREWKDFMADNNLGPLSDY